MPQQQQGPEITWTVTVPWESVNPLLQVLGQGPFTIVADVIVELRNQTQRQMDAWQQELQAKQQQETVRPPMRPNGEDRAAA